MQKILAPAFAYKAAGAIPKCRVVVHTANADEVALASTAGTLNPAGVSRHAADAAGDQIDVYGPTCGIVEIEAAATFARGANLTYDNAGKVKAVAAATEHIIGVADEACTVVGQLVGVRLQPGVLNT